MNSANSAARSARSPGVRAPRSAAQARFAADRAHPKDSGSAARSAASQLSGWSPP